MADLTSLYKNKPKRDKTIQACADCLHKVGLLFPSVFKKGFFTDYFDIAGGTQPPKSKFINEPQDGYIRFLQIRDFASEDTPTYIPISKNNKICKKDDLVLGRYGASVGKILTGKSGAYNVACAKILFLKDDQIDKDYLFYWLHSSYFQNYLTSISRSAQGGFSKNDLSRIITLFPPYIIQKRFVSILKIIDTALLKNEDIVLSNIAQNDLEKTYIKLVTRFLSIINENEELNSELTNQFDIVKLLRQSFLREAMEGKLVAQNPADGSAKDLLEQIKAEKAKSGKKEKPLPTIRKEEIPFEIPESWVWCRLGEICSKIGSGSTPKGSNYSNSGFPFFRSQNIHDSGLVYDDIKYISKEVQEQMKGTIVYSNDILLNITGG